MSKPKTERNEQMLSLYDMGYTSPRLAAMYGISSSRVLEVIKLQRDIRRVRERNALIFRLLKDGWNVFDIVKETGLTKGAVLQAIKDQFEGR